MRYHEIIIEKTLENLVRDWSNGYSKDNAFGGNSELENQILTNSVPVNFVGALYRGTGVSDEDFDEIERIRRKKFGTVTINTSPSRKLVSWTKSFDIAKHFAEDAAENGSHAVVLAMPSNKLKMIADVDELYPESGEEEVLVLNGPLTISYDNIVGIFVWEED